jgi:ubiquinone biosynthesis protein Coq4
MYMQEKRDPTCQWIPTNYKLTSDGVFLIANDWEDEWKTPIEQTGHPEEEEE